MTVRAVPSAGASTNRPPSTNWSSGWRKTTMTERLRWHPDMTPAEDAALLKQCEEDDRIMGQIIEQDELRQDAYRWRRLIESPHLRSKTVAQALAELADEEGEEDEMTLLRRAALDHRGRP